MAESKDEKFIKQNSMSGYRWRTQRRGETARTQEQEEGNMEDFLKELSAHNDYLKMLFLSLAIDTQLGEEAWKWKEQFL